MVNIVRLPSASRPRTFTTAEAMIEEVRTSIFGDQRQYRVLAEKASVSPSTIANLASGKTRWPRHTTLFPLLDALGLRMQLVKDNKK